MCSVACDEFQVGINSKSKFVEVIFKRISHNTVRHLCIRVVHIRIKTSRKRVAGLNALILQPAIRARITRR